MIFFTRIRETDQIFAHVENKPADMERAMTFRQGVSGNPRGNRHHSRHLLNQEFIQALLLHFREHGKKAIEKVAKEQPAAYMKILALLVPRDMKIEHTDPVKALSDEQLAAMIAELEERIARRANQAKVIEGKAIGVPALPAPHAGEDGIYSEGDAISERKREPARHAKRRPRQQAEGE